MALLDVQDLALSFSGLKVIRELSFSVSRNSIASLIGPNGAGKTSVFNCLTGFYRPDSGRIDFNGASILRLKPHRITRAGMARTFQNLRLFRSMTVLENVMSGMHCRTSAGALGAVLRPPSQRREEELINRICEECLAFVGMRDKKDRLAGNLPYLDEATDITTLAYHTYLIGPWNVVDPSYPDDEYFSDVTSFLRPTLTQEELVRTRGSQYQISLGYGGNLHDMLYLGLSVNMLTLDYEANKYYSEYNFDYSADDPDYNPINEINLEENLAISGTGFKAAFGLIFRPVPFLRVGASVTTPTYYTLRDSYRAALSADWNNFYYQDIVGGDTTLNYLSASSVPVESRYRLYTPFKISGGAALFLGKAGFITLDAEYQDYRNNWLSADNFSMDADNAYMENNFYQALNLKAGAELRINVMRLRAGYAIYQVPLNADLDYTPTNQQFSAGAGLRLKNFFTDLTLLNQQFSTAYTPYYLADNSQPVADIKQSNFKVLLTLGFRF